MLRVGAHPLPSLLGGVRFDPRAPHKRFDPLLAEAEVARAVLFLRSDIFIQ